MRKKKYRIAIGIERDNKSLTRKVGCPDDAQAKLIAFVKHAIATLENYDP